LKPTYSLIVLSIGGINLLLDAICFTLIYLGFSPKLSETTDSGSTRIDGIGELIKNSKFSIHDLSRMKSTKKGEISRFNMPFELGLDLGCKKFGSETQQSKLLLILDKEKYRYQEAISDLSGNDIGSHSDKPEYAVRETRNWIRKISNNSNLAGPTLIWKTYAEFEGDFKQEALLLGFSEEDILVMPKSEYFNFISNWIKSKT
jgi:hypothetical protein